MELQMIVVVAYLAIIGGRETFHGFWSWKMAKYDMYSMLQTHFGRGR